MGKVYSGNCNECNKLYNYDVGIGSAYDSEILLNINSDFNLLNLFTEKNRKEELRNILKTGEYKLEENYGHKMCICDTCGAIYSRFIFNLCNNDGISFAPKYRCHTCRKKLRVLKEEEILNQKFICQNCKKEIEFYLSSEWN